MLSTLACLLVLACAPPPDPVLTVRAEGDTLHVNTVFTVQGTPDSLISLFSNSRSVSVRHRLPITARRDSALLIPSPALLPGDTARVRFDLTPHPGRTISASVLYRKPPSGTIDSLTVVGIQIVPGSVTLNPGQHQDFTVILTRLNGSTALCQFRLVAGMTYPNHAVVPIDALGRQTSGVPCAGVAGLEVLTG